MAILKSEAGVVIMDASIFEARNNIILDCANRSHMRSLIALAVAVIGFLSSIALPAMLLLTYVTEKNAVVFVYIGIGIGLSIGFATMLAAMLNSESPNYYPRFAKMIYGSLVAELDPVGAKLDLEYLVTNEAFRATTSLKYAISRGYRVTLNQVPINMVENHAVKNSAMPDYGLIKLGTPEGVLSMGIGKFYTTLQNEDWAIYSPHIGGYVYLDQYIKQDWSNISRYMEKIILQSYLKMCH